MSSSQIATIVSWSCRAAWVGVLGFGIGSVEPVLHLTSGSTLGRWGAWGVALILAAAWAVGAAALAFQSTVTLTVARIVVPISSIFAAWCWVGGGPDGDVAAAFVAGVVATAMVLNADLGNAYVQASAYGAERRTLLRPPSVYLGLTVVHWFVAAVALVLALASFATQRWWIGLAAAAVGAALAAIGWPRWHKLARRWLVLVPIGLVIHDHVVLADTVMLGRRKLASLDMRSPRPPDALDLTGGARGSAIEIEFVDLETITRAATPAAPAGQAFHARTIAVAPSRPGRFLVDAARARLPVARPDAVSLTDSR